MSAAAEPRDGVAADDWDDHWTECGAANERNPAQDYRRSLCMFLVGRRGAPRRLLGFGSGNGELLAAASKRWPGADLAGLELSPAGVEETRRKVPDARVRVCDLIASPELDPDEARWATGDPRGLLGGARARR